VSVSNPLFARCYRPLAAWLERRGGAEHRRRLLEGLSGRVIEVGAGHGINFGYYPPSVDEVVAVEPERYLREAAHAAAEDVGVDVEVREGVAERLPVGDGEFDAAVVSLVLCSVTDPRRALEELRRVVRPGGEVRFYEHVRSTEPRHARFQRRFDRVWPRVSGGCHTGRDTVGELERAGLVVEDIDRFRFPPSRVFVPTSPHVLGRARIPDARP
jgi:ubiquinone/menaquinone biosynthesis C-methylase UbiE